jgi:TRAP-type C4-dicarboxylate transport system substrate-binding protein
MKIKALLGSLVCVLLFSLVAISCSSTTPSPTTAPATTSASKPATTTAPAQTTAAATTSAAQANAPANAVKLRLANYFPPTSDQGVLFQEFSNELQKRSNGQIQVTYYAGGTLFDGPATADSIKAGIADIGFMTTGHVTGRFPVSEAITAMNGYPDAYVVSHVNDDFIKKFNPKEWNDYKVLLACGNSPMVIFSNKPINTMADYKGTKSRVLGRQADQAKLLGASPINIPAGDSFDALTKGVIDNSATSLEAAKTWRLAEATKYCTLTWQVFSPPAYYLIMNKDSYAKLPDSAKKVLDDVSAEYTEKAALMSNNIDVVGADYAKKMGMQFIDLAPDEAAKWQAAVAPLVDTYVNDMAGKGYSKQEAQGWIDFIKERTDYWLKQQIQKGIKSPLGPKEVRQ